MTFTNSGNEGEGGIGRGQTNVNAHAVVILIAAILVLGSLAAIASNGFSSHNHDALAKKAPTKDTKKKKTDTSDSSSGSSSTTKSKSKKKKDVAPPAAVPSIPVSNASTTATTTPATTSTNSTTATTTNNNDTEGSAEAGAGEDNNNNNNNDTNLSPTDNNMTAGVLPNDAKNNVLLKEDLETKKHEKICGCDLGSLVVYVFTIVFNSQQVQDSVNNFNDSILEPAATIVLNDSEALNTINEQAAADTPAIDQLPGGFNEAVTTEAIEHLVNQTVSMDIAQHIVNEAVENVNIAGDGQPVNQTTVNQDINQILSNNNSLQVATNDALDAETPDGIAQQVVNTVLNDDATTAGAVNSALNDIAPVVNQIPDAFNSNAIEQATKVLHMKTTGIPQGHYDLTDPAHNHTKVQDFDVTLPGGIPAGSYIITIQPADVATANAVNQLTPNGFGNHSGSIQAESNTTNNMAMNSLHEDNNELPPCELNANGTDVVNPHCDSEPGTP